ncbi:MAG: ATP-dependent Clp protease ATP-binding subunit, partial [Pyrinomonadaceae bacterium]|nr:ATP-dependent Clp protease ATP-binding subunit [Pyrinomonadaceae bacterium]
EIIIFDELADADLRQIVDLQIGKLNEILEKRTLQIRLTEEAQSWLIEKTCGDRSYGARPLKRALQKYVEDELSEALIQGEISEESIIEVFCENDKLAFRAIRLEEFEKEFFEKA